MRSNDARDQHGESDIPEPVQHENRPECFYAFPISYRRPNVLRAKDTPGEKTEAYGYATYKREVHDRSFSDSLDNNRFVPKQKSTGETHTQDVSLSRLDVQFPNDDVTSGLEAIVWTSFRSSAMLALRTFGVLAGTKP